jgi:hypothetical protein
LEFCPTLLAFGPLLTLYSCILLLWWEACYFSDKPVVSQHYFTCLFLKCLSHPKWSHFCHCYPYTIKSIMASISFYLIDHNIHTFMRIM